MRAGEAGGLDYDLSIDVREVEGIRPSSENSMPNLVRRTRL